MLTTPELRVFLSDGSVTIVISNRMTDHPNSLSSVHYPRGNLAFRWFHAEQLPERPLAELVKVPDAPTAVS